MKFQPFFPAALAIIVLSSLPHQALAWGERGHQTICEVAAHLVQEEGLKHFLRSNSASLGYYCNVPDRIWKGLDPSDKKLGNPGHWIQPENLQLKLEDLGTDFSALAANFQLPPVELNSKLGSLWWRADQFYRSGVESGAKAKAVQPKEAGTEPGRPYNYSVLHMVIDMGIMGHFFGDASMPNHGTSNYDGWPVNQGGIHHYYEEASVDALDPDWMGKVFEQAKKLKPLLEKSPSAIDRMRALSLAAHKELPQELKLDPVLEPSQGEKPARRAPPETGAKVFRPLITLQCARSARELAAAWDEIYTKAGRPDLSHYHRYDFVASPDFIPPDYLKPAKK